MLAAVQPYFNLPCIIVVASHTDLIVALAIACAAIVVAVPVGASKGKLHVPGYVGLALSTFVTGLIFGRIAGTRTISGSPAGVLLSVLFFLFVATALGSILALFFYRPVQEE
jgi:hypothetical protein